MARMWTRLVIGAAIVVFTGSSWASPYRHTITIDGTNDFSTSAERFSTTTTGYYEYTTWDDSHLYLGYTGSAISSGSSTQWVLAYLDSSTGGTTTGSAFGTQQAQLPFQADRLLAWRMDGAYTKLYSWSGSSWAATSVSVSPAHSGTYVEMSLNWSDLGSPTTAQLATMLVDQTGNLTYAGMPSSAFVDGNNPPIAASWPIDLNSSNSPNAVPEPGSLGLLGAALCLLTRRRRQTH